jgi:hypothetical protein
MPGGRWLLAGYENTQPGSLFTDSLFVTVVDALGQTIWRRPVPAPNEEVHDFNDVIPTPDGGVVVSINSTLCDVSADLQTLVVLNPDGTVRWSLPPATLDDGVVPSKLAIGPDGNLIGIANCNVVKYNITTGAQLWSVPIPNSVGCGPEDFHLLPGTETLLLLSHQHFYQCKQTGAPNNPAYLVTGDWSFQGSNVYKMYYAPNGLVYLPKYYGSGDFTIFRLHLSGPVDTLTMSLNSWRDIYPVADGLYFLSYGNGQTSLLKTDFALQQTGSVALSNAYLEGRRIAVHGDTIAVAGFDYYGPLNLPYPGFKQIQGWFHTRWGSGQLTAHINDATAVATVQTIPINVQEIQVPLDQPYFIISGGHFQVQVKNNGNTVLNSFCLNTSLDGFGGECPSAPAYTKCYSNLGLLPGDVKWLEVDSLATAEQFLVPKQICFWVTSPNGLPDYHHEDNIACTDLILGTNDPRTSQLAPFPNPADAGFTVELPDSYGADGLYRLFDCTGKLVVSGQFADQQSKQYISTATLPAGVYWLRIGARVGKVVAQH